MNLKTVLLAGTVLSVAFAAAGASAAETKKSNAASATAAAAATPLATQAQIDALNKQIQALQAQLQAISAQTDAANKAAAESKAAAEKAATSATAATANLPSITFPNGVPTFTSADKAFSFQPVGRIHLDYGYNFQDAKNPDNRANKDITDGFNFRRAYIGFAGKAFNDFTYNVTADFPGRFNQSGRLQTAQLTYTGYKGWLIDVGAMQPAITFEDSISSNDIGLLERPGITNVVTGLIASEGRLSAGVRTFGDNYFADVYLTGANVNTSPFGSTTVLTSTGGATASVTSSAVTGVADDQKAAFARAAFRPINDEHTIVHVGADVGYMYAPPQTNGVNAAGSHVLALSERPENRYGGLGAILNTGNINANSVAIYGGEAAVRYDSFWAQGEGYQIDVTRRKVLSTATNDPSFFGYYAEAGWVLTGQKRNYVANQGAFSAPTVDKPLNPGAGQWGTWEAVARYSFLNLNSDTWATNTANRVRGGQQEVWTLGLNWYMTSNVRFMLDYQFIDLKKYSSATNNTQVGDNWQSLGGRVQFTF
ncbi:phosphate-selective porin OprO/OprP [Nitrospirillum amazonense]|uniref:Phosphate-selective porin OprO/OprP n=1 Tax=Nitrospirillum amazonense TaxID=28077 RepID=A0A560JPT2_9PROT|nr:porin [Nitrospirillum amazonense]TWB73125.1 phosphate-selective porin OprO/OprP [Nitrospirillum amazonense]